MPKGSAMTLTTKRFEEFSAVELYEILKLRNEIFVCEQDCVYQDCDDKDFKSYHMYYSENNKIIAYLRIVDSGVSYETPSIGRVVVDINHRRKKLSSTLITEAFAFAKNTLNYSEFTISAQHHLLNFYCSLGFEPTSEVYLEDNIPHIRMFKNL